nr:hypothetical protein OH837_03710 [Streptomyces canus]
MLSNVGMTLYTRLEQGRATNASEGWRRSRAPCASPTTRRPI